MNKYAPLSAFSLFQVEHVRSAVEQVLSNFTPVLGGVNDLP